MSQQEEQRRRSPSVRQQGLESRSVPARGKRRGIGRGSDVFLRVLLLKMITIREIVSRN